jgi:transposase
MSCIENGVKKSMIARTHNVSRSTIYKTIKRWEDHAVITSLPCSGPPKKMSIRDEGRVLAIVR